MGKRKLKHLLSLSLIFLLAFVSFGLTSCGENNADDKSINLSNSKVLVAYFSATGNTQKVADYIGDFLGVETFEIVPTIKYTTEDLNWNNANSRVNFEHNASTSNDEASSYFRPAFNKNLNNLNDYDVIFLGYPIWWGEAPNIVYSFLEEYSTELSGKTSIPFCTSSSSEMGQSAKHLHSLVGENVTWLNGQRFSSNASQKKIEDWINRINTAK